MAITNQERVGKTILQRLVLSWPEMARLADDGTSRSPQHTTLLGEA